MNFAIVFAVTHMKSVLAGVLFISMVSAPLMA
jgi:hypothetical protein